MFIRSFTISQVSGSRYARAGLILFAAWVVLEIVLMKLIANRFGWGTTVLIHALKGGFGLLLLGWLVMRGLKALRRSAAERRLFAGGLGGGFSVASAVLIAIPGLIPALIGVALFTPSLRSWIIGRFAGDEVRQGPQEIDLEASEWRETRKPRRPRRQIARKPSLEGEPPSV